MKTSLVLFALGGAVGFVTSAAVVKPTPTPVARALQRRQAQSSSYSFDSASYNSYASSVEAQISSVANSITAAQPTTTLTPGDCADSDEQGVSSDDMQCCSTGVLIKGKCYQPGNFKGRLLQHGDDDFGIDFIQGDEDDIGTGDEESSSQGSFSQSTSVQVSGSPSANPPASNGSPAPASSPATGSGNGSSSLINVSSSAVISGATVVGILVGFLML